MPATDTDDAVSSPDPTKDLCACGCGMELRPNGPSMWYIDDNHQRGEFRSFSSLLYDVHQLDGDRDKLIYGMTATAGTGKDRFGWSARQLRLFTAEMVTRRGGGRENGEWLACVEYWESPQGSRPAGPAPFRHYGFESDAAALPYAYLRTCVHCKDRAVAVERVDELLVPGAGSYLPERATVAYQACPGCRRPHLWPALSAVVERMPGTGMLLRLKCHANDTLFDASRWIPEEPPHESVDWYWRQAEAELFRALQR